MATIESVFDQQIIETSFGESYDPGAGFSELRLSEGYWNFTADFIDQTPTDVISVNFSLNSETLNESYFLTEDTSLNFEVLEAATVSIISYDSVPIALTPIQSIQGGIDNIEVTPEPLTVLGTLTAAAIGILMKRTRQAA